MNLEWLSLAFSLQPQLTWIDFVRIAHRVRDGADADRLISVSISQRQSVEVGLRQCADRGLTIVHPLHSAYPLPLFNLERPPIFLVMQGEPFWQRHCLLSVVGTRRPSRETAEWVDLHLHAALAALPLSGVVSGGAIGVDQLAHAMALRLRRPTAVVLPCGHDQLYPRELRGWVEPVLAAGGCLISEYLPQESMRKHHFHRRNRLIAALSPLLLLLEGGRKSGTLMTAHQALRIHREIAVVPTSPMNPRGRGTLDLLMAGAHPVCDAGDLMRLWQSAQKEEDVRAAVFQRQISSMIVEEPKPLPH